MVSSVSMFNYSSAFSFDPVVDWFNNAWSFISPIITFIGSAVEFLINFLKTIFNYTGQLFQDVFSDSFFEYLSTFFEYIYYYFWSFWGGLFIVLFVLAFFLMIFWFIMRVIRGAVNYNSALKKFNKHFK